MGGCVRDLLVGITPKDFDIVTAAEPEEVYKIVRPSHIIGKRFRLVLARRHGQLFEISTFRSSELSTEQDPDKINENIYGTPEEDALRRDFTINGLFYDPVEERIIDHTRGLDDIKERVLRMIGDPKTRMEEDPVRILRALRLSHKICFSIETEFLKAMAENIHLLEEAILPRVREEFLKIFRLKNMESALWQCKDLGALDILCPTFSNKMDVPNWANSFFGKFRQGSVHGYFDLREASDQVTLFLYAYLSSDNPSWENRPSSDLSESCSEFLRGELGFHKIELENFTHAIHLLKTLLEKRTPEGFKPRHLAHFLRNRSLPLALKMAGSFYHLSDFELYQWREALKKQALNPPKAKARPRRPRSNKA